MNSDPGWETRQHLPLGMAFTVSSESIKMHQKSHPKTEEASQDLQMCRPQGQLTSQVTG